MSNAERGLERHVNPDDPTGPMLEKRPDVSTREKPPKQKRKRPETSNKKIRKEVRHNKKT